MECDGRGAWADHTMKECAGVVTVIRRTAGARAWGRWVVCGRGKRRESHNSQPPTPSGAAPEEMM
eukprot:383107-Alexandrium_andersonii.AAC.1